MTFVAFVTFHDRALVEFATFAAIGRSLGARARQLPAARAHGPLDDHDDHDETITSEDLPGTS